MSNRFLFELGTEEIPASMIDPALDQMRLAFEKLLEENGIEAGAIGMSSTPRRLAVFLDGLPDKCPDREETVMGPPASVAFDEAGRPTPAATGFARKQGVEPDALEVAETDRGSYVLLRRRVQGEPVPVILGQSLETIIASISWPKTMYWTESRFRFIRPLRWFVCLWNDQVIPFRMEGVESGRTSRGHRLIGPAEVEIREASAYVEQLREACVLVDRAERLRRITQGLEAEAGRQTLVRDDGLLETVVHLNEFPSVLRGQFDPRFLEIPGEVLVTVMRYHQKYFSLKESDGKLAPAFLTVLNTTGDPDGRIRRGHEKVLQARLEDAAFFWQADRKTSLKERLPQLGHVLFQESLGTYLDKTRRLQALCRRLDTSAALQEAAELCKIDLTTDMVRELTELQGVMGGLYAREEGYPEEVWKAVYEHYRPVSLEEDPPSTREGALLSMADRLDTLVGCFGAGIVPSGSSDPFALRRQAQGLIAILLSRGFEYPLSDLVDFALDNYPQFPAGEVRAPVLAFLEQRLFFQLQRAGLPQDVLKSVFSVGIGSVPDARDRAQAVASIKGNEDFDALAIAFKRARNLLGKADERVGAPEPGLFAEAGEEALFAAVEELRPRLRAALDSRDYLAGLRAVAAIRPAVDRFFDDVLVMADDPGQRRNRLALLQAVSDLVLSIADPSEIVQQGGTENGR
ncbi:MAG: glycine--tRNA ligase subunit beta [Acidobacteriota bacterium]